MREKGRKLFLSPLFVFLCPGDNGLKDNFFAYEKYKYYYKKCFQKLS